jgi:hypothetical protein
MWILWAVLLYFLCSIAAAILFGKCLRFGLRGGKRGEDILKGFAVMRMPGPKRSARRFRESAAFLRAVK